MNKNLIANYIPDETNGYGLYNRREFIKGISKGGCALFFLSNLSLFSLSGCKDYYSMIVVDYSKCAGCRTCETVCSSFSNKKVVNGEELNGLGNPYHSSIKVYHFNPEVTVPNLCVMCPDAPCIKACPILLDPETGQKALFRDRKTHSIKVDSKRCNGCGYCADACRTNRAGIIFQNPDTNKPEHMCTLCEGDPQCVKYCPQSALSHKILNTNKEFYGLPPEKIAVELIRRLYDFS